jgi:hypothetical protein
MNGPVTRCRMCDGTSLEKYLDLGLQPPADQFLPLSSVGVDEVTYYPLDVRLCQDCGLSQLGYVVPPEILYQQDYPYEASTTAAGRQHFGSFAEAVSRSFGFGEGDLAVDIGSNVGVLLDGFKRMGLRVLGVDPAQNITRIAIERGIPTITGFFSRDIAEQIREEHGRASVVTGTNVFAHIDDLEGFAESVDHLLSEDGVLVIEAPYLSNLLRDLEYDTIYHEHLSYLSVQPLARFFARFSMEVFDVHQVDMHGGSMRVFVDRAGRRPVSTVVQAMIDGENASGLYDLDRLRRFSEEVAENRRALRRLLYGLKDDGATLALLSAPAKGMTLLNYCGFGRDVFDFATEKSQLKIGRCTPGGQIPVVSDDELLRRRPDFAVLLAWNFATEIMHNLRPYADAGGKFILPIPMPRIVP